MGKKHISGFGKIIAGIVIGGAVGSVLGLTLAPHTGKKTREMIVKKANETIEKIKES